MSTRKHQPGPAEATIRPPIVGPTRTPACMPKLDSALAATSSSWRTVRGSSASREGRCSADAEASRPETTKISHSRGWEEKALMHEPGGEGRLGDAGPDQQQPAVDVVGERAAVQTEDDQRDQLDQADGADREVGVGELVDLEGDGDVGHHPAEVEDRPGDQEQAEVTMLPERPEVHPERAKTRPPPHRRHCDGAGVIAASGIDPTS